MVFSSLPTLPQTEVVMFFVSCVCVGVHVCVGVGGKINNTLDSERRVFIFYSMRACVGVVLCM